MQNTKLKSGYAIPAAIIIAGALIAGALFARSKAPAESSPVQDTEAAAERSVFRLPNDSDHVRGDPNAAIALIEFSDLECPFCARLHPTLARLITEHPDVQWIYRHFPLASHSRAFGAAVASECTARLGGNDAFWKFTDDIFANQRNMGKNRYAEFAQSQGIPQTEFASCLADREVAAEVQKDLDEVIQAGGRGTPFVVIVSEQGKLIPFSGALPYEQVVQLVAQARNN